MLIRLGVPHLTIPSDLNANFNSPINPDHKNPTVIM